MYTVAGFINIVWYGNAIVCYGIVIIWYDMVLYIIVILGVPQFAYGLHIFCRGKDEREWK